jgi:hypothetical protein
MPSHHGYLWYIIKDLKTQTMKKAMDILKTTALTAILALRCTLSSAQNVAADETTSARPARRFKAKNHDTELIDQH